MSVLPRRFPRASLLNEAAQLDSRLTHLSGDALLKEQEATDRGMDIPARKFHKRWEILDAARAHVNAARLELWNLE